jgi:hypothetical protein
MIVVRDDLQALECTGCHELYELPRPRGREDELNERVEFRKRLEAQHVKCGEKVKRPMREHVQIGCKLIVLAICMFVAFGGNYPPATAQVAKQGIVPVLTVEDAVQDAHIGEINDHLKATDAEVARNWAVLQKNAEDISGMQGEERGIGGVLGLLSGIQIVLQIRKKAV